VGAPAPATTPEGSLLPAHETMGLRSEPQPLVDRPAPTEAPIDADHVFANLGGAKASPSE
jgi:hypothetical protein